MRNRYRDAGVTLEILGCGSTGYGELFILQGIFHRIPCRRDGCPCESRVPVHAGHHVSSRYRRPGHEGHLARPRHHHEHSRQRGMFLRLRFLPGKLRFHVEDPGDGDRRRRLFLEKSGGPRQPLHRFHEQQHRHRAEKREKAGRYHGRSLPFHHRECLHEGHPDLEPRLSLGDHIMVQGGTFRNDAVLRAFEQYTGKTIVRAPYPGMMGAIGAAILTKEAMADGTKKRTFIGLDAMDSFSYTQEANAPCPFCTNHCKRTIVRFPNGQSWVSTTAVSAERSSETRKIRLFRNFSASAWKA